MITFTAPLWIWNSLKVSVATTIATLLITVSAGYALSRFKFRGRGGVLTSLYAVALIFRRGGLTAVGGNILLNLHRLQTAGRSLIEEDEYETVPQLSKRHDRRQRLIPFSAMAAAGLAVALAWQVWQ